MLGHQRIGPAIVAVALATLTGCPAPGKGINIFDWTGLAVLQDRREGGETAATHAVIRAGSTDHSDYANDADVDVELTGDVDCRADRCKRDCLWNPLADEGSRVGLD